MANDLLIKINADAKNVEKAYDDIRDQTGDLEGQLKGLALVSAAAFAAFTAEIFFSVKAFEEAEAASLQLSNALQNQGIFTEELKNQYVAFADAVQAKTGIDNDAIIKSQAIAQSFLGQTQVTEELSFAIADLGATMNGDLNGAAEKIARTIGTGTNAFARQGLVIRDGATEAERYAQVLEFVQLKAGGLAAEFNKADGFTKALQTSFGNFQETIGARFAPIFAAARQVAIAFFDTFTNNPVLADLVVAFIAAGAAVTGVVAIVSAGIPVFLALSAAVTALGVSFNIAFVGIPLAIGVIVAAVTFLALNWDKAMSGIAAASQATVTLLTELFGGLGKVLSGAFTLDPAKIKAGLDQITASISKSTEVAIATYETETKARAAEAQIQNADKAAAAEQAAAIERQHQANLREIRTAEIDLLRLQNQNASAEIIALKSKEIETLKALDSQKSAEEIALFQQRREQITASQAQAEAEDFERQIAFAQLQAQTKAELDAQGIAVETGLKEERLAQLRATSQSEADIDRQLQDELLQRKIATRNQDLLERKKYGLAVATINKALNSEEVQGARSASADLVALQQSKNATLKTIGKVAAVAQITINTAESAMNIYKGFSTIPIIGPALGIAGAAAAVAFGAERISQVTAAQTGGLIEGGIPGRDSVPALLEPGELVVPRKNFNEVVGAVQNNGGGQNGMLEVLTRIEAKISTPQTTIINGDVLTDDAVIDSIIRKISDAIEFKNAQIFGVTA